ncbi:LysR family transcriptional regulator [Arthrobacter sp. H41]|uniref:LysR family transcriptional regulator n=1 Tax=Arthrobacter sp. H41 TaxID=1312978 RepID=UPI0009DCC49B|nr:LysR family transcriptional regulator [Arthrobacter sp. H41]
MLDPHRLIILRAVISAGSVHGAAAGLHLAPATVSQHLRILARQTGLVLFEKSGRGIEATPAALHLAEESGRTLADLERLERTVADLRVGRAERITFSCFASVAQAWMPHVVGALRIASPRTVVEISINELHPSGGRRQPDIEIRNEALDADPLILDGYQRHVLTEEELRLVLPLGHPLCSQEVVDMVQLRDEPWIDHDINDGPTGRIIARACTTAGFTPRYVARLDDHHAALSLAAAGLGLTVLPPIALTGMPDNLTVRPLAGPTVGRRIVAFARTHPVRARLIHDALTALREIASHTGTPHHPDPHGGTSTVAAPGR